MIVKQQVREVFLHAGIRPREGQVEAAERVASVLERGGSAAFVAPTGFGKTLVVLAALKAAGRLPAVWRVRSLSLGSRVGGDAALLGLRSFTAAGRERACPLAGEKGPDVHEYCRSYRLSCSYFLETDFSKPVAATTWTELLNRPGCPYYLQDLAMESVDVVIQSYYRRPPRFYRGVVYDEAHNLLAPRETCVTVSMLREAALELKTIGEDRLARWLAEIEPREDGVFDVEEERLLGLYGAYRRLLGQGYGRTATGRVYRVLGSEAVYWESGRLCGARLSPATARPNTLYVSATLPYPQLLGVDEVVEVPWTHKRTVYIAGWLTTRYRDFERYVEAYAGLLRALRFRLPRVLAFATRRVAARLLREAAVDYYEQWLRTVPAEWRGVMLLHSRGKFAEGVDIRADAVVVLGAPFLPPYASRRVEAALRRAGLQGDYTSASMLSTTLQCIGRATRSKEDNPLIILADHRYTRYTEELSKYYAAQVVKSLEEIIAVIQQRKIKIPAP